MKGTLDSRTGRHILRFERALAHPPEKVWHALVDNGELAHWFPARIEGERATGAPLQFAWHATGTAVTVDDELAHKLAAAQDTVAAEEMHGEMRIFDPPRTLEYTWHTEILRFELIPDRGGTRLVFTHTFDDKSIAVGAGAGWHISFDALDHRLDGHAPTVTTAAALASLEAEYRERFGAASTS